MEGQKLMREGPLDSSPGTKSDSSDPQANWSKKYYVLFNSTQTNKARLDWFNDKDAFQNSPTVRKTIFVEEMRSIKQTTIPGHQHGFQIETLRRTEPFLFSAATKKEQKQWVDSLNKLLSDKKNEKVSEKAPMGGETHLGEGVYGNEVWGIDEDPIEYEVRVGDTPSAQNLHLDNIVYKLQIYSNSLFLYDKAKNVTLYVWPYKLIRRYGRSRNSFTFEAGRRCASGEGVFILLTDEAEEIFNEVQKANAQQDGMTNPHIPSRNYTANHKSPAPPIPGGRDRSFSAGAADPAPPVPTTPRPAHSRPQPLPPSGGGVPLAQAYASPSDGENAVYSSITEGAQKKLVPATSEYGYSEPEPVPGTGMTAVVQQLRNVHVPGQDEYDEVALNPMKKRQQSNPGAPEYGQLYIQSQRGNETNNNEDDPYDEVGQR